MKRVRERKKVLSPSTENDYSDWYRRDAIEMEGKIKAKDGQLKQVESQDGRRTRCTSCVNFRSGEAQIGCDIRKKSVVEN